jgi:hypothetical protein
MVCSQFQTTLEDGYVTKQPDGSYALKFTSREPDFWCKTGVDVFVEMHYCPFCGEKL